MTARSHLAIVPQQPAHVETAADRAKRLLAEARAAAVEHIGSVSVALETLIEVSADVAEGGEAYPAGVRDLCRRMTEDLQARLNTLDSIMSKSA